MNQGHWNTQLKKSILNNQQLEYCNNFTLGYIHNNKPESIFQKCRLLLDESIIIYLDGRTKAFNHLSEEISILWHFPLSREIYQIQAKIVEIQDVEKYWITIDKEEKKSYHSKQPDQYFDQVSEKQQNDLEKFNMQDKQLISPNFKVMNIIPYDIVLTKELMPQVVADSRTKFESIFRPYKQIQKIKYEKKNDMWLENVLS